MPRSEYQTILKDRNGAGLVLWVVPSDQIYKDTLKALRDRRHFYRESLEFALSRRIEVWEKQEIARLTPAQLRSSLNILLLKLASTNCWPPLRALSHRLSRTPKMNGRAVNAAGLRSNVPLSTMPCKCCES